MSSLDWLLLAAGGCLVWLGLFVLYRTRKSNNEGGVTGANAAAPSVAVPTGAPSDAPQGAPSAMLLDASTGHTPQHGHYLARACDLAYLPVDEGRRRFREELNLDAQLISVDNTQAWLGQNESSLVLAFRGSESPASLDGFKDWLLTNARNFLVIPEGRIGTDFVAAGVGARFHRGFMEALNEVWEPLHAVVEQSMQSSQQRPLWVTGHSLGGAIALLCAWRLHQRFLPVHQICTFGAPMIGNAAAAAAYQREFPGKVYRYVDAHDLVPRLPMVSLLSNPYGHCQTEIVVGSEIDLPSVRKAVHVLDGMAADSQADENGRPINSQLAEGIWGNVRTGISAHLMGNYLSRISDQIK